MGSGFSILDPFGIIPDDFNPFDPFGILGIEFNPLDPMASFEPYKYQIMGIMALIIGIVVYRKFIKKTPFEKMQEAAEMQQMQRMEQMRMQQYI